MSAALQKRMDQAAANLRRILEEYPEVRAEVERAYRRGYHQAAYQAAEAARVDAFTPDDFEQWAKCISRWRYAQKGDDFTCPPEPWETN